jgi:hypothetical protein
LSIYLFELLNCQENGCIFLNSLECTNLMQFKLLDYSKIDWIFRFIGHVFETIWSIEFIAGFGKVFHLFILKCALESFQINGWKRENLRKLNLYNNFKIIWFERDVLELFFLFTKSFSLNFKNKLYNFLWLVKTFSNHPTCTCFPFIFCAKKKSFGKKYIAIFVLFDWSL